MDLSLNLTGTHVLITGGAGLIGSTVVRAFLAAGAHVSSLDIAHPSSEPSEPSESSKPNKPSESTSPNPFLLHADTTSESSLSTAWSTAVSHFGPVSCCITLAALDLSVLPHPSIADMPLSQFLRTLEVNVGGTFLAAREWVRGLRDAAAEGKGEGLRNVGCVLVGSESGSFGERTNADYAASKSAVQVGLMQSLRADVGRVWRGARVNAIAPGPVDTPRFRGECKENPEQYWLDAQATTAMGRPVSIEAVAKSILYLASENLSGHVHGQVLSVDGGKQGKVMWTKEECE